MHQCLAASTLGGMGLGGWKVVQLQLLVMLFDMSKGVKIEDKIVRTGYQEFLEYFSSAYTRGKKRDFKK